MTEADIPAQDWQPREIGCAGWQSLDMTLFSINHVLEGLEVFRLPEAVVQEPLL